MGYYPPGENEDWLYMYCPVSVDKCKTKSLKPSYWYHKDCGGQLKIGTHLNIICTDCGRSNNWQSWRFKCAAHDFYEKIDRLLDFYHALNSSLNLDYTTSTKREVIYEILRKILK